ncbi:hypothetical protein QS637_06425, partial [Escherichia coli]|nr:hypothetical protein [Escherichia coli]
KIYLAETPWFNISATIIRERLQNGESCAPPGSGEQNRRCAVPSTYPLRLPGRRF